MQTYETCVVDIVERVVAERYAVLSQTAQFAIDKRDRAVAVAPPAAVEQLIRLALLDVAATFVAPSRKNLIKIDVEQVGAAITLELVATGLVAGLRRMDYFGAVTCAAHTRRYGGEFRIDKSKIDRRVLRISLPAAA